MAGQFQIQASHQHHMHVCRRYQRSFWLVELDQQKSEYFGEWSWMHQIQLHLQGVQKKNILVLWMV
uniref:Uncharacterized protein n=1 Tax=Romanomermis culicivorax TaxID=13658 RepID=A0A915JIP4_ROMCU